MHDFRRLIVWERARDLALVTYRLTESFPVRERYGRTAQMWRAAVSVANIAESCGMRIARHQARFLISAFGSASALDCEAELACDLRYLGPSDRDALAAQLSELRRMLTALIRRNSAL
jgi:four helix bundle protein